MSACTGMFVQGDTYEQTWTLTDSTGAAVNLTGCTVFWGALNPNGTSLIQCASSDSSGYLTISDAAAGVIALSIPPSVTSGWSSTWGTPNAYMTALKVQYTNGTVRTEDQGTMRIMMEVANG